MSKTNVSAVLVERARWTSLAGVFLFWPFLSHAELQLPTPLEHYQTYQPQEAARDLLSRVLAEPDGKAQALLAGGLSGPFSDRQIVGALETIGWSKWRGEILELLLHYSSALEALPSSQSMYLPAVHDSLLLFLDRLPEERLLERLAEQGRLPLDASRRERLLAFVGKLPTLQKLGQILARNPGVDAELRPALEALENSLSTMSREEVVAAIESDLGTEIRQRYQLRFAGELVAEASVGAVIAVSFVAPGEESRRSAVCKVLKPYAVTGIKEELAIMDEVLKYLEAHADFYQIGATPLVEIFQEVREALGKEIRVEEEQANLSRARAFYRDRQDLLIPEIYPFSARNVTCMEYVKGEKIVDAFPGNPQARRRLAGKFSDVLTYEVIFSPREEALFHGDPHAGNVFHVEGDKDPYRIALLDWGLCGVLTKHQRAQLVQLLVGLYLRDSKRLANNLDSLVEWGPEGAPGESVRRALSKEVLEQGRGQRTFELLYDLAGRLAKQGYALRFQTVVFIKAQLTIYGILKELDPEFEQDAHLMGRLSGRVWREIPARLGRTLWFPAWNSHDYRSLLSNEDLKDIEVKRVGRALKAVGKGIWSGLTYPVRILS